MNFKTKYRNLAIIIITKFSSLFWRLKKPPKYPIFSNFQFLISFTWRKFSHLKKKKKKKADRKLSKKMVIIP